MLRNLYILILFGFLPILFTGQETVADWGTNKYIDELSEKCVVSVAENGWIYLLHHYNSSLTTDENGWKIYCSEDGGLNFEEKEHIEYSSFVLKLVSTDMVVAGNDPDNIRVYIAELTNAGEAGWEEGSFRIYEYDGIETKILHETPRGNDSSYAVAIACDSRAPATVSSPYTIAAAWSGYGGDVMEDQIHYSFSVDGGNSFTENMMYSSSRIGNVDLAIGNTVLYPKGYFALAFELNNGIPSEYSDIGLLINDIKNLDNHWATPLMLSEVFPVQPILTRPSVCLMQDGDDHLEDADFVPLVLFAEDVSNANNHDLLMVSFSSGYAFNGDKAVYPDSADLAISYPFGNISVKQEINPNVVYDPWANNFLLTYSTKLYKELIYAGINIDELELNEWWSEGSYRSNTGNLPENPKPHIDIDPSRGKAVYSWRDEYVNPISPSKSYFDTEWWTVGINEGKSDGLLIYPNPATTHLYVQSDVAEAYEYIIYDASGRQIMFGKLDPYSTQIIFPENLESGIYFLHLSSRNGSHTSKIILK